MTRITRIDIKIIIININIDIIFLFVRFVRFVVSLSVFSVVKEFFENSAVEIGRIVYPGISGCWGRRGRDDRS